MKIINRARRSGKTTMLIYSAYCTQAPILVKDSARARSVIEQSKELGCNIEVFTLREWSQLRGVDKKSSIFIDEATDIIELALQCLTGSQVLACTVTIPFTDNKNEEVSTNE